MSDVIYCTKCDVFSHYNNIDYDDYDDYDDANDIGAAVY